MSAASQVWVVVPTYDEAETIETLVRCVRGVIRADRRVLVVDDASPDGTGEIADRLAAELEDVGVLHRPAKRGLGPAYIAGFGEALRRGADLVVQMDADLSHDPAELPSLIEAAADADLVVGSRYVDGGQILDWGPGRRAISRWGSVYARGVLGLAVRDLTSGFKCWRAGALRAVDPGSVRSRGYAFQVEMTYRAIRAGLHVVEVPITFRDRRVGQSKMSRAIVLEAAWKVPLMRLRARA